VRRAVLAMSSNDPGVTLCGLEKIEGKWHEVECRTRDGFVGLSQLNDIGFAISNRYREYLGLDNE
jgi:hypothetical protein